MNVFVSWSGQRSGIVAELLSSWLQKVIQAAKPWCSSKDIEKGARWTFEIAERLEATSFGVIVVTPENCHSEWLHFEAGALSRHVRESRVAAYLVGLEPPELAGPLAQFQCSVANEVDTRALLHTLNARLGEARLAERVLDEVFDQWWPHLARGLQNVLELTPAPPIVRESRDMISEVVTAVRELVRNAEIDRYNSSSELRTMAEDFYPTHDLSLPWRKVVRWPRSLPEPGHLAFDLAWPAGYMCGTHRTRAGIRLVRRTKEESVWEYATCCEEFIRGISEDFEHRRAEDEERARRRGSSSSG